MKTTTINLIVMMLCIQSAFAQSPEIQWQKAFGGSDDDYLISLDQTTDGGYILGGYSYSGISGDKSEASLGNVDYWVVKLTAEGNIEWENSFGGSGWDDLISVQQTMDGGYILGGYSTSGMSGDKTETNMGDTVASPFTRDYWIIKLNSSGVIEWQNTIGGSNFDYLGSIRQTTDGGYIVGGYSVSGISGDKTEAAQGYDYWVLKLNSSGIIEWQNTIGGSSNDYLRSIQQTADGGYILGGSSLSGISDDKTEVAIGGEDYWIMKLNSTGAIEWQNTIGGTGDDIVKSIHQTSDGGFIVGGSSESDVSGDKTESSLGIWDYWVVKLSDAGEIEWQNSIGGGYDDLLYTVQQTSDGGYILGGASESNISGDKTQDAWEYFGYGNVFDYWVVKLNSTGVVLWDKTLGGYEHDYSYSLQQSVDGGYIVGGAALSYVEGDKTVPNIGGNDYWLVKLYPDGCPVPQSLATSNITSSVAKISWNEMLTAASYKVRYKESGSGSWLKGNTSNTMRKLKNLLPNTTYVWQVQSKCGSNPGVLSDWSEKQFFTTALRMESHEQAKTEWLIYPNPCSSAANISFSLLQESEIKIELFDLQGRKIKTIAEGNFEAGNHQLQFERENLTPGIYLLQLQTNSVIQTQKLIIQ